MSSPGAPAPATATAPPTAPPVVGRPIPCSRCGYLLTGLPFTGACPECSTPVSLSIRVHHSEDADASLALLFGTLALIAPILGLLLGPIAMIFFSRSLAGYERKELGRGAFNLALIGLVLGIMGVIVSLLVVAILLGSMF